MKPTAARARNTMQPSDTNTTARLSTEKPREPRAPQERHRDQHQQPEHDDL
jgi:hypothetical protein